MPNRAKILFDLDKLIAQVKETQAPSVFALNLNRFKQVNDTFGLPGGRSAIEFSCAQTDL